MLQTNSPPDEQHLAPLSLEPGEKLLFTKRKHWYMLFLPLFKEGWIGIVVIGFFYIFFSLLSLPLLFFFIIALPLLLLMLGIMGKTVLNWYFHFYAITTQRIIEYCCRFPSSRSHKEIAFHQVLCTEIEVQTEGKINQFLNKGTLIITFNYQTSQEEMRLENIPSPRDVGSQLAQLFDMLRTDSSEDGVWFRAKVPKRYFFLGSQRGGMV